MKRCEELLARPKRPLPPHGPMTFAELIGAVETDLELASTRRRDVKSAITAFCRRLNVVSTDALASMAYVRKRIDGVHPKQIGLKPKRWQNVLSEVRFAVNRYGPKPIEKLRSDELVAPWRKFYRRLPAPGLRYGLSRFIKFCAGSGVAPENVAPTTFLAFEAWLEEHTTSTHPRRKARDAAYKWNKTIEILPEWPGRRVELSPARDAYCIRWQTMPEAFRWDAEAWLRSLGEDNWASEDAPLRPLRPASIEVRRFQLRQAFSILARCGHPPDRIASLGYLVEPAHTELVLSFFWERSGQRPSSQAAGMAACLLSIARHWVKLGESDIRKLQRMKQRVSPPRSGLTAKNRTMLRQFDDDRNKERLLMFPIGLIQKAARLSNRSPIRAALLAQTAACVEILIMMPIRLKNLANLHLERNFDWRGDRVLIVIPGDDVKNSEPIEFELLGPSVELIETYLERFRRLLNNGSGYLLPGTLPEKPKNPTHLSRQISRQLFLATGLVVTPHQFRHVAAKIWLDDNPGSYEVIRRVLHHRRIDTTTANYTGFETRSAALHYDTFILRQRQRFLSAQGGKDG